MKNYTVFISILISLLCFNVSGANALKNKSKTPLIITLGVSAALFGAAAGTGAYYILRNRAENMTEADRVEREINLAVCIEDLDGKLRKAKRDKIELNRYIIKQKAEHDRAARHLQNNFETNQAYIQRLENKINNINEISREEIDDEPDTSSLSKLSKNYKQTTLI